MQAIPRASIDTDLTKLESQIRELKVKYDMFFGGGLSREPHELRQRVERTIKHHSSTPFHKYVHRFRFNALVSRFNSFSELWGKTVRALEEGDRRTSVVPVEQPGLREKLVARCRVRDTVESEADLRRLHSQLMEVRRKQRTKQRDLPYDSFVRGIASQARKLRAESGCDQIELRLVVRDDQIQLKARPGD